MSKQSDLARITMEFVERAQRLVVAAGITTPPVDPRKLAELAGVVRIVLSSTLEASGELVRDPGGLVIRLRAREFPERHNFSICHEVAHIFALDYSFSQLSRFGRASRCHVTSLEERLCDVAAAEMLMPRVPFASVASTLEPSIEAVTLLAKRFGASVRATLLRIGQLSVWPVVFIGWKFTTKIGSVPKLRVCWSVRPEGTRCFVPLHASANSASSMHATLIAAHPTCETEELRLGSLRGRYLVENARFGTYVVSIVHDPRLVRRRM